jgi:hypothetical protein
LPTPPPSAAASPRLTRALAAVASAALTLALVFAAGWWRASRERVTLEGLGPEERQALVAEMLAVSPGAFETALFEPAVGYTLKPGRRIEAWGDAFTANEIGYRTRGLKGRGKPRPFRVAFAGDSWTFGLGLPEAESFPARFEELASSLGAAGGRGVEAVNLGLPGYNTFNEVAALEFFWDRVRPDAVVLAPTPNDADSAANILPNGSLTRAGVERDPYGADHSIVFRPRLVDSFLFRDRWRRAFAEVRRLEGRLAEKGVPLLVYFAASWDEPFAHKLMRDSGLASPYVVTPRHLTTMAWRNPEPWRHGNPEANRLYARMVYQGLAETLGWPPLPAPAEGGSGPEAEADAVAVHRRPPEPEALRAEELLRESTERIPETYTPGPGTEIQCVGPMDCASGLSGKATTVLVRRRAGAGRVVVTLGRLPGAPSLTPLPVEVEIPSPAGGTRVAAQIPADGPAEVRIAVPIPADVPAGAALDVTVRAARAVSAPRVLAPRSFLLLGIEQE